jgi:hypothetical protein
VTKVAGRTAYLLRRGRDGSRAWTQEHGLLAEDVGPCARLRPPWRTDRARSALARQRPYSVPRMRPGMRSARERIMRARTALIAGALCVLTGGSSSGCGAAVDDSGAPSTEAGPGRDASIDSKGGDSSPDADCGSPTPANNDPRCPSAANSWIESSGPCPEAGLTCTYPGLGDGTPNGCPSARNLTCGARFCAGDGGTTLCWVLTQ